MKKYTIAVLGSHSALDVCRGAKDEGFKTLVIAQKGREKTYTQYYKTDGKKGCVDECIVVNKFSDILKPDIQKKLLAKHAIFIPHRSFEVYINDYEAIEKKFKVPIFGNRFLLKYEERGQRPNQYDLLEKAKVKYPKVFKSFKDIDRLVLVKVSEKERGYERAFFLADSPGEYRTESAKMIRRGIITKEALDSAVIEEFILGIQVDFNFFYSPMHKKLELIGIDSRRQTDLDGLLKLPEYWQRKIKNIQKRAKQEEAGHIAVTVLESLLEQAFEMGERFVKASQDMQAPGVIGPFALQACITPGPPKKDIVVFDVSPRMPGSPGIGATPYSGYLYGESFSMGRRLAMEIKLAIRKGQLKKCLT